MTAPKAVNKPRRIRKGEPGFNKKKFVVYKDKYKDKNGKVTPLLYPSYTQEKLKNIKSIEVDKIKVKGKEELITIYKPI